MELETNAKTPMIGGQPRPGVQTTVRVTTGDETGPQNVSPLSPQTQTRYLFLILFMLPHDLDLKSI